MTGPLDIAVVGSGISGLGAAWLLSKGHRVTLFERDDRLGGHANTVDAPGPRGLVPVDTGFIVYNVETYPNLIALFDHLSVPTARTDMGFAVSLDHGAYEYSGTNAATMFAQWSNLFNPTHYRMIADIMRFFREAPALIEDTVPRSRQSLGEFLDANRYSKAFVERHILPMAAAIWSTPSARVLEFPAASFVRFYASHGLLRVGNRPEWRTVAGGSREYVKRLHAAFSGTTRLSAQGLRIRRAPDGVTIATDGAADAHFDACVVACPADEALSALVDADSHERALLGAFQYSANRAVLHTDASFMPRRRRVWSSWNYLGSRGESGRDLSVSYWMNALQPLGRDRDYFVTLNPTRPIAPGCFISAHDYRHPQFDDAALDAQRRLWSLQGRRRTWFCGSYFGYGFHEDGLQSGLAAAEHLGGIRRPWSVPRESGRLQMDGQPGGPGRRERLEKVA